MRLPKMHHALQLTAFLLLLLLTFSVSRVRLRNCKSVFLILKISQYGGQKRWVQLFLRYSCKNWYWYKDSYFHFHRTRDHKTWQADTSRGVDSDETNKKLLLKLIRCDSWRHCVITECLWPPNLAGRYLSFRYSYP